MDARPLRALSLGLVLGGTALSARAHGPPAAAPPALAWTFEPWVLVGLLLSAGLYALGVARLWRRAGRGHGLRTGAVAAFAAGWLGLAAALVSPLDALGARLFSAHMLQHELLMIVAAPLLVIGRPLAAWAWALPPRQRARVGAWARSPWLVRPWRLMVDPLFAWALHAAVLWVWHLPALFEAALNREAVHTLQHFCFLFSALLFWWAPLCSGTAHRRGAAMFYLFTTMVHTGALGALLTFAATPWYPSYADGAASLGFDPLEDQQLGGLIMWVPAGAAYLIAGLAAAAAALRPGPAAGWAR